MGPCLGTTLSSWTTSVALSVMDKHPGLMTWTHHQRLYNHTAWWLHVPIKVGSSCRSYCPSQITPQVQLTFVLLSDHRVWNLQSTNSLGTSRVRGGDNFVLRGDKNTRKEEPPPLPFPWSPWEGEREILWIDAYWLVPYPVDWESLPIGEVWGELMKKRQRKRDMFSFLLSEQNRVRRTSVTWKWKMVVRFWFYISSNAWSLFSPDLRL